MRHRSPHPRQTHFRDAALRKLSRLNGVLIAGSVVLTGVFAEAAAATFKGKSGQKALSSAQAKKKARRSHHAHASTQLRPPASAPQPAPSSEPEGSSESSAPASPAPEATPEATPEAAPEARTEAPVEEAPAPVERAPEPQPEERAEPPVVSGGS